MRESMLIGPAKQADSCARIEATVAMPERVSISIASFPRCPACEAEAHVLTFRPAVESDGTRVLSEFAWRCPSNHVFATAMPDLPLLTWRRAATEDLELAELAAQPPRQIEPTDD